MFLVLDSKLSFSKPLTQDQYDRIMFIHPLEFDEERKKAKIAKYVQIREIDDVLDNINAISKFNGEVLGIEDKVEGRYKVSKNNVEFESVELKVTAKRIQSEKTASLTNDDKMKFLNEFIDKNKRLPEKREIYAGCNVGNYYHNIVKWSGLYETIKTKIEEINGNN